MSGIQGKSIIVTGGASGIGEAAVRLFAQKGAKVTCADLGAQRGQAIARELSQQGHAVQFVRTDVTNEQDVEAMVAAAVSAYGRLDGAFNNAGVPNTGKPLNEVGLQEFQKILSVNVVGPFLCMKHEFEAMARTGGGSIVNTASVGSVIVIPKGGDYTTSKHALLGLTKAGAVEFGARGIRVNAIAPSTTRTPMYLEYLKLNPDYERTVAASHALGRGSEPIEQAQAALWLLSGESSYVTGALLMVDGGYTLL